MNPEGNSNEFNSLEKTPQQEKQELNTLLENFELKITELKQHIVDTQSMPSLTEKSEWTERLFSELGDLIKEKEDILNKIASIDIEYHDKAKSIFRGEGGAGPLQS